jgi:hypothetical protein
MIAAYELTTTARAVAAGIVVLLGLGVPLWLAAVAVVAVVAAAAAVSAARPAGKKPAGIRRSKARRQGQSTRPAAGGDTMLTWTQVQARLERAREALENGQYTVRPDGRSYYVRNGENQDGDPYTVTFVDHPTGNCTCPDFTGRGPTCKHILMVVLDQWPDALDRYLGNVRHLCRSEEPEPTPEQETPPAEQVETLVRQAVHDALSTMEEQITQAVVQRVHGAVLGVLARE